MVDEKYIKCKDAIKELYRTYEYEFPTASGAFDEFATRIVPNVLRNLPAADVRPVVHGRWIAASDTSGNEYYRCSECGTYFERTFFGNDYTVNGCPVCFADMRENTDQEQGADNAVHRDTCGATGLPCCRCNPGACESRK